MAFLFGKKKTPAGIDRSIQHSDADSRSFWAFQSLLFGCEGLAYCSLLLLSTNLSHGHERNSQQIYKLPKHWLKTRTIKIYSIHGIHICSKHFNMSLCEALHSVLVFGSFSSSTLSTLLLVKNPYLELLITEILRENKRQLDKAIRELDRERMGLQTQEKKLIAEIKKTAKQGQMVWHLPWRVYVTSVYCWTNISNRKQHRFIWNHNIMISNFDLLQWCNTLRLLPLLMAHWQ